MHFISIVGARPNFMKLAPVARAFAARAGVRHSIVHTGQHYDAGMSATFFEELAIPQPDLNLEVGSDTHARQTARIMERIEPVLTAERPDAIIVYGDVNSTIAAALVAAKLGIRIAHVEAGLRSGDWSMPEEINRVVTDRLADWLLIPSRDAAFNLQGEGLASERVHFVGNVMIDSVLHALPSAKRRNLPGAYGLTRRSYVLLTLHRPSNVDDLERLADLMNAAGSLADEIPVLFPVHPRTRAGLSGVSGAKRVVLLEPLPYVEMLGLVADARLVITDSGGLQEETSFLGVPCITVRPSTERPVTITGGTNQLVLPNGAALLNAARTVLSGERQAPPQIERWDGHAAERIAEVLVDGKRWS